jgi:hypothetical protein
MTLEEIVARPPVEIGDLGLAAAADDNLAVHAGWVQERLPEMRVRIERDPVLVDSGLPCDTFNLVCRARLERDSAPQRIRETVDYSLVVSVDHDQVNIVQAHRRLLVPHAARRHYG